MIQRDMPLSIEGRELRFDMYDGSRSASRGALVFLHGGGFVGGCKEQFMAAAACIALQTEYVCFSVDYSLAPEHAYPEQIKDVWAVCRWIKAHAQQMNIDENRIILAGGSPGGYLAAMSVLSEPEQMEEQTDIPPLKCAILLNPILNLQEFAEMNPDEQTALSAFMPQRDLWKKASPHMLAMLGAAGKSFFILHGELDQVVPLSQVQSFARSINASGGKAEVFVYPREAHAWFNETSKQPAVIEEIIRYLNALTMEEKKER